MKATSVGVEEGFRRGPSAETEAVAVLAIVVTHRGRRWIRECLAALANQSYELMDILVVDDASPDHRSAPALKRIVKRHCRRRRWGYLRTARPLGFGGAINWALSRVRTDAELLLFVHDDAALEPDALASMVRRIAADPATAILGPKIVGWNDPSRLEEVGMAVDRFGYPYKGLERGEIDVGQHDHPSEVFFVTSTCMLVRHEVFRTLGVGTPACGRSRRTSICAGGRVWQDIQCASSREPRPATPSLWPPASVSPPSRRLATT